ncbi:RDD family protein [Glycomyces harbinensis]|uniref:RDD family protein n=1 Tax=Glycomyces harbinensis TaxID=58114 RepID=A0A1G6QRW6_9ACTN|nr:RDD family protein [Glycomyces harbinensis]SDC94437.1 RDD family protein [Glycomyces harbinensis]
MAAKKVERFGNGTPYVPAGNWTKCFAWLIDFAVFVLGLVAGVVALVAVDMSRGLDDAVIALVMIAWWLVLPLLYGLCLRNGRALGAMWTGTRLVRVSDGGRIGAKGPWAMFVRLILLPAAILGALTGGGLAGGSLQRTSIDMARTRQLHVQGYSLPPR